MDDSNKDGCPTPDLPTEIWTEVLSYLNLSDVKQARLVCKRISAASNASRFIQKSKFIISHENLAAINEYLDDADHVNYMLFEHVELSCLQSSSCLMDVILKIGLHVKTLKLNRSPIFRILNGHLLKLHHLSIGVGSDGIWGPENTNFIDFDSFSSLKAVDFARKLSTVATAFMMYQLSRKTITLRLDHLRVDLSAGHEEFLIQALEIHAETLNNVHIHLQHQPSCSVQEWSPVWPKLKQLRAIQLSGECPHDWLESAFTGLSQQNTLTRVRLSRIEQIQDSLVILIARKWPTTLQRLEISMSKIVTNNAIAELGLLRENLVELDLSHCSSISAFGLFRGITFSTNNMLRRLNLNNLPRLSEASLCSLAQSLPNLIELGLECCLNGVTNKSSAQIFRYLSGLHKIVLDDCPKICDTGLVGSHRYPWPISRLVDLQSLSLCGCINITDRSLQQGLKLPNLRHLNLGYCNKISNKGIKSLTVNCPAIEDLALNSCTLITDEAVLSIARGMHRLEKLNLSNCVRLTATSLKSIAKYCQFLSELTVCGIAALRRRTLRMPNLKSYRV